MHTFGVLLLAVIWGSFTDRVALDAIAFRPHSALIGLADVQNGLRLHCDVSPDAARSSGAFRLQVVWFESRAALRELLGVRLSATSAPPLANGSTSGADASQTERETESEWEWPANLMSRSQDAIRALTVLEAAFDANDTRFVSGGHWTGRVRISTLDPLAGGAGYRVGLIVNGQSASDLGVYVCLPESLHSTRTRQRPHPLQVWELGDGSLNALCSTRCQQSNETSDLTCLGRCINSTRVRLSSRRSVAIGTESGSGLALDADHMEPIYCGVSGVFDGALEQSPALVWALRPRWHRDMHIALPFAAQAERSLFGTNPQAAQHVRLVRTARGLFTVGTLAKHMKQLPQWIHYRHRGSLLCAPTLDASTATAAVQFEAVADAQVNMSEQKEVPICVVPAELSTDELFLAIASAIGLVALLCVRLYPLELPDDRPLLRLVARVRFEQQEAGDEPGATTTETRSHTDELLDRQPLNSRRLLARLSQVNLQCTRVSAVAADQCGCRATRNIATVDSAHVNAAFEAEPAAQLEQRGGESQRVELPDGPRSFRDAAANESRADAEPAEADAQCAAFVNESSRQSSCCSGRAADTRRSSRRESWPPRRTLRISEESPSPNALTANGQPQPSVSVSSERRARAELLCVWAARACGVWEHVSLRAAREWLLLAVTLPALVQLLLLRLVHLSSHQCRRHDLLLREPPDDQIDATTSSALDELAARDRSSWRWHALEWLLLEPPVPLDGRSLALVTPLLLVLLALCVARGFTRDYYWRRRESERAICTCDELEGTLA